MSHGTLEILTQIREECTQHCSTQYCLYCMSSQYYAVSTNLKWLTFMDTTKQLKIVRINKMVDM